MYGCFNASRTVVVGYIPLAGVAAGIEMIVPINLDHTMKGKRQACVNGRTAPNPDF
ncbi:hypothetical protein [Rhizobium tropici]|uniref:hypothetical protein n=1 Tax=Rhizobium tropici TaxID=398 RepID=UPI00165F87B9|nr:hypothetical protein [Rhizobium tropici]